MQCTSQKFGYYSAYANDYGNHTFTQDLRKADTNRPLAVPCGKCRCCLANRARDLGTKAYHESLMHEQNCFLTVTYDNDHYDPNNKTYRDAQLFLKRLRKNINNDNPNNPKFRYLAVGESGDTNTYRWHYHFLIFGYDFLGQSYSLNNSAYANPLVDKSWGKGLVYIDNCTPASCNYVAGYVTKKIGSECHTVKAGSKQLGKGFAQKYYQDALNIGSFIINGTRVPVPKSYFDLVDGKLDPLKEEQKLHIESLPTWSVDKNHYQEQARDSLQRKKAELTAARRRAR